MNEQERSVIKWSRTWGREEYNVTLIHLTCTYKLFKSNSMGIRHKGL
jgi:hypothetical protein